MNKDTLEGSWKEIKGRIQQKWGKLTNEELDQIDGKREELIGRIQRSYGHGKDAISRELDDFLAKL